MSDERITQPNQETPEMQKDSGRERMLLTPPARKLRMSRKKVEH